MYVDVPCIPYPCESILHNTINYVHLLSLPNSTLMSCTEWNQPTC